MKVDPKIKKVIAMVKGKRAFEARMTMQKIDVAAINAARRGYAVHVVG